MLPPLDHDGTLPAGIHAADLAEVLARFGVGSPERQGEGEELADFVGWAGKRGVVRMLLGGSSIRDRIEPNDVES